MSKKSDSIGRRRSRSRILAGTSAEDLCEKVPLSLSPSERLKMIFELSVQHALSEVKKEFKDREDVGAFEKIATEGLENAMSVIEEKNLLNLAVAENVLPLDESLLNANVEPCNQAIAQLEAESAKWDEQKEHLSNILQTNMKTTYTIDSSEWKGSDQLYDYSDVLKYVTSVEDEISEQLDRLHLVNAAMSDSLQINDTLYRDVNEKVEKYFTHTVPDTPRTIIKNMAGGSIKKP